MGRVGQPKPDDGRRLRDRIGLGVLTATYPQALVDEAIESSGKRELRYRLLPARMVVYYVLAMTLFQEAGYEQVLRELREGLPWRAGRGWSMPSAAGISRARKRLGPEPLKTLFTSACVPLAQLDTRGAFYRGWRVVSMDSTTLDAADTADNGQTFGRASASRLGSVSPQLRIVALAECGTRAIFAAAMGAYGTGDPTLASQLVTAIGPGMLILAGRGFSAHPLFAAMEDTGAQLCWRAKPDALLPVVDRYLDGSFRSEVVVPVVRGSRRKVVPVRVTEYTVEVADRPPVESTYRLVTTILDPKVAPAHELAALYSERWEFESALDELRTHQGDPRVVLRSKTADGVYQEAWGLLCVHYAMRALLC